MVYDVRQAEFLDPIRERNMRRRKQRPSVIYRNQLRGWLSICVHPENVGLDPGQKYSELTMDDLEAAYQLAGEACGGAPFPLPKPPRGYHPRH